MSLVSVEKIHCVWFGAVSLNQIKKYKKFTITIYYPVNELAFLLSR